jgi:dCMP deaminase
MKPTREEVWMNMARAISALSPDVNTKVGAVLISPTGRQIASGYNGFLRGAFDDKLPTTRPEKYQYMQHAERNVLYNCLDEGIKTRRCMLVCTLSPCLDCLRACYQSGINYILFDKWYDKKVDYEGMLDLNVTLYTMNNGFTGLLLKPQKE